MKYLIDTHTHTIASGHAYNTIKEMAQSASEKGLELLGITEHAMKMPGTCHSFYFANLKMLERKMFGVEMLFGVELNILNQDGEVDMEENLIKRDFLDSLMKQINIICKNTSEQTKNIYIDWTKLIRSGNNRGCSSFLAKKYGISRQRVDEIVKDINKKIRERMSG